MLRQGRYVTTVIWAANETYETDTKLVEDSIKLAKQIKQPLYTAEYIGSSRSKFME